MSEVVGCGPVKAWVDGGRIKVKLPGAHLRGQCRELPGAFEPRGLGEENCFFLFPESPAAAEVLREAFAPTGLQTTPAFTALLREARAVRDAAAAKEATDLPPIPLTKTEPWLHQLRAFWFAYPLKAAFLTMGMGTGKSKVTVDLAVNRGHQRVLILCPRSVIQEWPRQFRVHGGREFHVEALNEQAGSVQQKAVRAYDALEAGRKSGTPVAIITNYESAWRPPFGPVIEERKGKDGRTRRVMKSEGLALTAGFDLVVLDECVPGHTLISTPTGERPISEIRPGDVVWGYDHLLCAKVPTAVFFQHKLWRMRRLHAAGSALTTGNHLVWTRNRGYVSCEDLNEIDELLTLREGVLVHRKQEEEILLQPLRESESRRYESKCFRGGPEKEIGSRTKEHAGPSIQSGDSGKDPVIPSVRSKPVPKRGGKTSIGGCEPEEGFRSPERRKRGRAYESSTLGGGRTGLGNGACYPGWGKSIGPSPSLQGRYRQPGIKDSRRDRRTFASHQEGERSGRPENRVPRTHWMAGNPVLELGCSSGSRRDYQEDPRFRWLFDLETGTANYFANGVLVHNSHRVQGATTQASRFAARLGRETPYRICLSGTPMSSGPISVFGQYLFLDPGIFGTSLPAFRDRYCVMGGFEGRQIIGYQREAELQQKFYSIAFRVESDDVLDLPPAVHLFRTCTLGKKAMKAYEELKRDLTTYVERQVPAERREQYRADLDRMETEPGGLFAGTVLAGEEVEVTVANALVKLLRLQQLTGGWAVTEDGEELRVDTAKEELLEDVLRDFPAEEPIVVVCRFRRELEGVHAVCARLGRRSGELSGQRDDLQRWKAVDSQGNPKTPEFEVLAVQIQSGAEGVDFTRAAVHVNFSVGYSLGQYEQILRRTLRPGQTRSVKYIHLQAEDTIDEKVYAALVRKRAIVKHILADLR